MKQPIPPDKTHASHPSSSTTTNNLPSSPANIHYQTAKTTTSVSKLPRMTWVQLQHEYYDFAILFKKQSQRWSVVGWFACHNCCEKRCLCSPAVRLKTLRWTIAKAAYLFSVKAGVNLLLFILIIPLSLTFFTKYRKVSKISANVWGARVSLLMLADGSTAIGPSLRIWVLILSESIWTADPPDILRF